METLPILLTDSKGVVVRANAAAQRRFGRCVGRACADVVAVRDAGGKVKCDRACAAAVASGPDHTRQTRGAVGLTRSDVFCTTMDGGVAVVVHLGASPAGPHAALTPRELDVVNLVAEGKTMKETAAALGIGVTTVRTHLDHARDKLGAARLSHLVARAVEEGVWRRG